MHEAVGLRRSSARKKLNDYNGAIKDDYKFIELNHNYVNAFYNRGITWENLKNYNGAIKDFTKAIELNPDYADASIGVAMQNIT